MKATIIFPDKSINIDGIVYYTEMPVIKGHENVYSIVWEETYGEVDYKDGNLPVRIEEADFATFLRPCVDAWNVADIEAKKKEAEQEAIEYAMYHSQDALEKHFRRERDKRLSKTDFYFQPDYPAISEENMKRVKAYRTALRDMPMWDGFPWDGGGYDTPWPELELK